MLPNDDSDHIFFQIEVTIMATVTVVTQKK